VRLRVVSCAAALGCAGCTGHALFTTPRTVTEQTGQTILAPAFSFPTKHRPSNCLESAPTCEDTSLQVQLPGVHAAYRYGIAERVEIGVYGGIDSYGADVKWNAVRTRFFDLALLPRLSVVVLGLRSYRPPPNEYAFSGNILHLPVLLGLNLGPVTLVASPGAAVVLDWLGRFTLAARAGGGVQVRVASWLAIQPEVDFTADVAGPSAVNVATVGIGFAFPTAPYATP
jgi:hypothetical protein